MTNRIVKFYKQNTTTKELSNDYSMLPLNCSGIKCLNSIYTTGGFKPSVCPHAYSNDLKTLLPSQINEMNDPRAFHSTCQLGNRLYALGGCNNGSIAQCENLFLASGEWIKLPDMEFPR